MKLYLFIILYERQGTLNTLPIYQTDEQSAREYALGWGKRLHVEIREVRRVSQWAIRFGAVLVGEIEVKE